MEPYVDFFGFMAYDLHGFWDADVKTLGSIIRPQTDIREIDNNTLPLWFDKLDPAKVNLGLAYYGRGYTVSDRSCGKGLCMLSPVEFKVDPDVAYPGCAFSGPNKAGPCTGFDGVMSNRGKPGYIPLVTFAAAHTTSQRSRKLSEPKGSTRST